jgi:two-component system chemotaxis response regulator CheB
LPIRVLVIDDSQFSTQVLKDVIDSSHDIKVIDIARNGRDGLAKAKYHKPDVITVDLEMPLMDGFSFISEIAKQNPEIPVVVISGYSSQQVAADALQLGVVEMITKPSSSDLGTGFAHELLQKIRGAAMKKHSGAPVARMAAKSKISSPFRVVVIGASTGGPSALIEVMKEIPGNIEAPFIIVQHMLANFTEPFSKRLNSVASFPIKQAQEGDVIEPGKGYVAPGDFHMEIVKTKAGQYVVALNKEPKRMGVRPAINVTMTAIANCFGPNAIGVLLTGMGEDGAFGLKMIKKKGGRTIAQDESTSTVYGMPKAASREGVADSIKPLNEIASEITRYLHERVLA